MSDKKIQHIIIIDIDGLRRDVLYNTLAEDSLRSISNKKLPNLSKIVGNITLEDVRDANTIKLEQNYDITTSDSMVVNHCVTVFPSYTYPAQASIFTGLYPKNHGITANFHFDREGNSLGARGKSRYYSNLEALSFYLNEGTGNRMLKKKVQTLYDYLHLHHHKCAVSCNLFVSQSKSAVNHVTWHLPWNFEGGGEEIDWLVPNIFGQTQFITECAADGIGDYRDNFDTNMIDDVLDYISEFEKFKKTPPNLITLYFGGHDHQAHLQGEVALQRDYLINTVDVLLGKFLAHWNRLAKKNSLENTLFVICSDHGHTRCRLNDYKRVTGKEIKSVLKRLGYDVLDQGEVFDLEKHCSAIVSLTAGVTHIFIRKGVAKGERSNWKKPPAFQDLHLILKELSKANQKPQSATNFLANALDFILFKDYENNRYQIYEYDLTNDSDVIKPVPKNFGADKNYVQGKERLDELYCTNSGDILLLVNYNGHFRFEKNRRMRSTHGSLVSTDSYVPLIFAMPENRKLMKTLAAGSYRQGIIPNARVVDIVPTILHLLDIPYTRLDGRELL